MKYKNQLLAPLAVGFFIGAVTVGTLVLVKSHKALSRTDSIPTYRTYQTSTPATAAPAMSSAMPGMADMSTTTSPLALDPAVARVASRFTCACGKCEDRADVCNCDTAQGERSFIQKELQAGHTETEVIKAVKQKYGGLKSAS